MRRSGLALIDVVVAIALVGMLAMICAAQVATLDGTATRIKCASNLRQIGQAILLYSNENRGAYPRTKFEAGDNPKPVWGTPYEGNTELGAGSEKPGETADPFGTPKDHNDKYDPKPNDVTAALFLLMRTQDLTSNEFVCPATFQRRWDFGGGANNGIHWTNWRGNQVLRDALSYSYQNPYPSRGAMAAGFRLTSAVAGDFAVASDINPGTAELLKVNMRSSPSEMRAVNSPNHNREGQNLLYGDGHVTFEQNPFAGVKRDNIYTCGVSGEDAPDKGGDAIVGSPVSADDSILLPTARDIGSADEKGDLVAAKAETMTADQIKAFQQKFIGKYSRKERDRAIQLQVTDGKIVVTSGPLTVNLEWQVVGTISERTELSVSGGGEKSTALVEVNEHNVTINGNDYLQGQWRRE